MEQLMTAVPLPRTDAFGWGIVCPVHRELHADTAFMDVHREDAEAYAAAVRCGEKSHESGEYSSGDGEGYRVRFDTIGDTTGYVVHRYVGARARLTYPRVESWTGAHRRAFLLARR